MSIRSPRRYCLHKRQAAKAREDGLENGWRAKQEAYPGSPLPADFPSRARLAELGYTTFEDLEGATRGELRSCNLHPSEIDDIFEALPSPE